MTDTADMPVVAFPSSDAWAEWLEREHASSDGVWLKIAKKGSGVQTVSYAEALDVALCYGWIDGQKGKLDDTYFLQRFTPRRPKSEWSQINRAKAVELIEQGRMQPAGLREVERAKADGRWDAAYAPQSSALVPPDLQRALDENEAAREFFATLKGQNRYAILYRIGATQNPETRARRIEQFVAMLAEGKTIYP